MGVVQVCACASPPWLLHRVGMMQVLQVRVRMVAILASARARVSLPWLLCRMGVVQVCACVSPPWLLRRVGVMQVRVRVAYSASSRGCDASLRTRACVAALAVSSRGRDAGARARRFLGFITWVRC